MLKMEKINAGGRANQLWCVVFVVFIFVFPLFYFPTLMHNNNLVQSSTKDYVYSILGISQRESRVESCSIVETIRNVSEAEQVSNVTNRVEVVQSVCGSADNESVEPSFDPCSGRYVYVHNLPSKFNTDLLKECRSLNVWTDMCRYLSNEGLGPQIENSQGVFPKKGWFVTNQFALDVIFHNRMKQYKCLTENSTLASAIYVPFYAGLDIGRYLWGETNTSIRDSTSRDLFNWLTSRPEWKVLGGKDHFLVAGRIIWDFVRVSDNDSDWGNRLATMPEARNMSILTIESSHFHSNSFAIPYPTYFHPWTDNEVLQWQKKMTRQKKRYLFSFAGAPRPNQTGSIRGHIIDQCQTSKGKCKLLNCNKKAATCDSPSNVIELFQKSVFCLQPPGDSYTRRSAFDSVLAGCIPVFFHPESAYTQYIWHLPKNYTKYSVYIDENEIKKGKINIEKTLSRIPKRQVKAMKNEVINLIPKLVYADPRSRLRKFEDALDIAIKGVIGRVNEGRR